MRRWTVSSPSSSDVRRGLVPGLQFLGVVSWPEECRKIVETVRALGRASTLDEIMKVVRESARELSGADGVTFVQRHGDHVYYADEDAVAPLWKGRRFRAAECISGWAMTHRESVVIEDVYADDRIPREAYEPTFVKSLAIVPIREDSPVGAIGAYWAKPHRASHDELEMLQLLADAAAMAMDRLSLKQTLRSQDEMLRIVTHDMRNPLNTMAMAATLLAQSKETGEHGDRVRKHAATIHRAAMRLERLISDLADSAAIEAGVFSVRNGECTARAVLDQIRDLEGVALEHHHVLTVEHPATDVALPCAADRLAQAIGNLVRNAVTHTPGGTLIRVGFEPDHSAVRFFVEDDGPGIPAEVASSLFQRYARGGSATHGTGLGLFIVKGIVEAHGGTVDVTTSASGTRFSLVIPRPAGESAAIR
jgi:signal transduction histidine kinase